ncbi:MAG: hypothetical protein OEZ06_23660 [Myxococcales bacterium]|nr:hypothetical protein [Myxococcales bacterium]
MGKPPLGALWELGLAATVLASSALAGCRTQAEVPPEYPPMEALPPEPAATPEAFEPKPAPGLTAPDAGATAAPLDAEAPPAEAPEPPQ